MNNRGSKSVTTFNPPFIPPPLPKYSWKHGYLWRGGIKKGGGIEKKVTVKEQRVDGSYYMCSFYKYL